MLTCIRIEQDAHGNVFPEQCEPSADGEPWFDLQSTEVETDDKGRKYHFVP
jgi:hypothetical protein